MCQELESKYLLAYCIRTMQRELPTCKQGSLTMVAYTAKFHELSIRAKLMKISCQEIVIKKFYVRRLSMRCCCSTSPPLIRFTKRHATSPPSGNCMGR